MRYQLRLWKKVGQHWDVSEVLGYNSFDEAYEDQKKYMEKGVTCDIIRAD